MVSIVIPFIIIEYSTGTVWWFLHWVAYCLGTVFFFFFVTVFATLHAPVWVSTTPAGASAVVKVITTL